MTERTITLAKGGAAEREVPVSEIQVRDLWHLATRLRKDKQYDPRAADWVLETWHLAHDLLRHVRETPDTEH